MSKNQTLFIELDAEPWSDFINFLYKSEAKYRTTTILNKDQYRQLGFTPLLMRITPEMRDYFKEHKRHMYESIWFVVTLRTRAEEAFQFCEDSTKFLNHFGPSDKFWDHLIRRMNLVFKERDAGIPGIIALDPEKMVEKGKILKLDKGMGSVEDVK